MRQIYNERDDLIYQERVSSARTTLFFLTLTLLFPLLFLVRLQPTEWDGWAVVFLCFSVLFLFYTINYRTLCITLDTHTLMLQFGLFSWRIQMDNIAACHADNLPWLKRMGGAGIHFMFVGQRYRASFNFLEYPRLVVAFKRKKGPVQDISFSTRQPDEIIKIINEIKV